MFTWTKDELNDEQAAAINEPQNVLLSACPGSGKTRTLTYKIALELSKIKSKKKRVLAITYTNRAAGEIQDRIQDMGIDTSQLWIGTIHSFCLEWIIKPYGIYHQQLLHGYRIISPYDAEKLINAICDKHSFTKVRSVHCDHFYTSTGLHINCNDFRRPSVERVIRDYHVELSRSGLLDFEQILYFSYQLIASSPSIRKLLSNIFCYILVDEYQDTKEIQYRILSSIIRIGDGQVGAFIVGDPNQAIFSSLGGYAISLGDLMNMTNTPFKKMDLVRNYRSSERIIDYCRNFQVEKMGIESHSKLKYFPSLISYNRSIVKDHLVTELAKLIRLNVTSYGIAPHEICIVGPWWIHLASLTRALVSELPEFSFDGPGLTPFVQDMENFWYKLARLVLTRPSPETLFRRLRWSTEIIELLSDNGIDISELTPRLFLKHVNEIKSNETDGLNYLAHVFDMLFQRLNVSYSLYPQLAEHREAFFQSSNARIERIKKDGLQYAGDTETFFRAFATRTGITVSSIHGVKGAEFDTVLAFAALEDIIPHFSEPNKRESAKRILYVLASRARKNLHVISEQGRNQSFPTQELSALVYPYNNV
jgi:superfamily I DNA/RNA helicase